MKVFWDTNLFIYLWEKGPFRQQVERLWKEMEAGGAQLATSTLAVAEILVQPRRLNRMDVHEQYLAAFNQIELINFDRDGAQVFAQLRARYPSLRQPDAIQLACASVGGCDTFVTSDNRLSHAVVPGIHSIQALK